MSKFGRKFTCWKCATKFYDLGKPSPKCPKCGANPDDDPNRGAVPAAAPATYADEAPDDLEPEVEEDVAEEDDAEDEEPAEPAEPDDY